MSDKALVEEVKRARLAKDLLENPLYAEAMELLKKAIQQRWEECPVGNQEQREYAFLMMKLHKEFREHFEHIVERGKMAEKRLMAPKKKLF